MLKYNGFAGCCGSGILFGFRGDAYFTEHSVNKQLIAEQEKEMENFFSPRTEDIPGVGVNLCNVSFVHAVLNKVQMKNEPMLLKYGFKPVDRSINMNTQNEIVHYIRTRDSRLDKEKKKVETRMFA